MTKETETKIAPHFTLQEVVHQTEIYLATSPQVAGVTGKCFMESREKMSSRRSYDQALGQRLWQVSEQLVARAAQPV